MCSNRYGNRGFGMRHEHFANQFGQFGGRGSFKVPVNIIKNDDSYELQIFAPDRAKEDFKISIKGNELSISYELQNQEADNRSWIRHEFRKSSFERSFLIDETVDTENIKAEYSNGILYLMLPIIPGSEKPAQEIRVL